ncbi:MAG: DndE family protein [Tissierellia bacterium]|nr:DndE family protein [Tissierellia bacterium]
MSSNKLQLSKLATKELDHLSARLDLRPNIVCRLALGRSLTINVSVKKYQRIEGEEKGVEKVVPKEFNRFTLTGNEDALYKILIYQHEYGCNKVKISENQYYQGYFRLHLERGLDSLYYEYQRVNSPVQFLRSLIEGVDVTNGKVSRQASVEEYRK